MSDVKSSFSGEHVQLPSAKADPGDRLLEYDQLPDWQRDNRYIFTGYRRATHSYKKAAQSLAYIHNQTGNIFSHLLAMPLLVTAVSLALVLQDIPLDPTDIAIFAIFALGATTCFLLSTTFHTFACHSPTVEALWLRLDFLGIAVLTASTFISGEYYLFYCEPTRQAIHFSITSSLALLTILVLTLPTFQGPRYRPFRLLCFSLLGLSGFAPMIDSLLHHGWIHARRYSVGYYLVEMLVEIVGAVLYASRVPERFAPGRFDLWAHSHQWFHLCAVAGTGVHVAGLTSAVENTKGIDRCLVGW
ncbi:hypothetical protein CAC42_413 [Sphaceloma murrayae]|uniref:Uncharacterized protein n=1 Tax=Sphaceloma murrayae TaxID=2082308 RepID=A0A2K1R3F3_9PEZI|nr:hypothetical protein CAC42_413 [Sphaceloma murrayae]